MFARFEVPKAANLDTAIRDFRARFDKISEVYYPQKDAKGRRGYGDFRISDPIKTWDFISHWSEIDGDEDEPHCEIWLSSHEPKTFVKLAKHFPQLWDEGQGFFLSQQIHHRQAPECYLSLTIHKGFHDETELELNVEERVPKGKKSDSAVIDAALRDLWQPTAKHFCNSASLTLAPHATGTKFKGTKADAKFGIGSLTKQVSSRAEVIDLINSWAKWSNNLPKTIKVMDWHISAKFPEADSLKYYLLFRKLNHLGAWLSFTGKYRKDFKIDSVIGKFPSEGYWRFPLFRATAGLVGAHELVELVLTPDENFFEYGPMKETHVEKLKTHKKFRSHFTLYRDQFGCTSDLKTLMEHFNED